MVGADADLNPGDPTVVGSAYTNSSFGAGLASSTVLDALDDAVYVQSPPNNGTLTMPKRLDINVRGDSGFDIAGQSDVGYVATASDRRPGAELYRVDVLTGDSVKLGQIGRGSHRITGLAAVQGPPVGDPPYFGTGPRHGARPRSATGAGHMAGEGETTPSSSPAALSS